MTWILGLLGPQGIAIAFAATLLSGTAGGAYAMHRWDNASKYYEQVQQLKELNARKDHRIATMMDALAKDAAQADKDQLELYTLQAQIDVITIVNPSQSCFTSSESDSLRGLFAPSSRLKSAITSHSSRHKNLHNAGDTSARITPDKGSSGKGH